MRLPEPIQLDCVHERPERLLAELAIYGLDVVLADAPAPPAVKVRAYSHLLGECAVSVFGTERLAAAHRRGFPRSLDGAPFLLPSEDSALRLSLEEWFQKQRIRPRVVGTFEDSALLDAFGQAGAGLFAMPAAIEAEVRRQYRVRLVGRLDSVRQRFYAITVERKLRNPAVIAISERARASSAERPAPGTHHLRPSRRAADPWGALWIARKERIGLSAAGRPHWSTGGLMKDVVS